jgi:hypothetical protein
MGRHAEAAVRGCRPPGPGLTGLPRVRGTRRPASGGRRDFNGIGRRSRLSIPPGDDDPAPGGADPPLDGQAHRAAGRSLLAEANPGGRVETPRDGAKGRNDLGSSPILKSPQKGSPPSPSGHPVPARFRPLSVRGRFPRAGLCAKPGFFARHFIHNLR